MLVTIQSYHDDIFQFLKFQEFINELGEMFSIAKKGILNLFEVLHIPQNDLGKGPSNTLTPPSRNFNNANINSNR